MIERFINTKKTLRESTRNPDVNSQGQIDEDGDSDEVGAADDSVNDTSTISIGEGHPDLEEDDDSPAVQSLTVVYSNDVSTITARVGTATGAENKRFVLPGHLTAKRLATAIADIASW